MYCLLPLRKFPIIRKYTIMQILDIGIILVTDRYYARQK